MKNKIIKVCEQTNHIEYLLNGKKHCYNLELSFITLPPLWYEGQYLNNRFTGVFKIKFQDQKRYHIIDTNKNSRYHGIKIDFNYEK